MKVRFWVVSKKNSLRSSLNGDKSKDLAKYPVRLRQGKKIERNPGWNWVHSRYGGKGSRPIGKFKNK